jgi:hypothetical protein
MKFYHSKLLNSVSNVTHGLQTKRTSYRADGITGRFAGVIKLN